MLEVGSKAIEFQLPDSNNNLVKLDDFKGKRVVLYFYPKDNTSGCTQEALNYKDNYDEFINNNTVVIGISKDSSKSHFNFQTKYELPFILLSDESLSTIKAYDVWKEKKLYGKAYMGIKRTTYVIDENGTIIYADDKVVAKSDAEKVLCFLKK